ncbi:MAG: hypothetical protein U5K27_05890 [Desulfotignum sp.]|nr:hypothetical protein [Desulfotignum sp.]
MNQVVLLEQHFHAGRFKSPIDVFEIGLIIISHYLTIGITIDIFWVYRIRVSRAAGRIDPWKRSYRQTWWLSLSSLWLVVSP